MSLISKFAGIVEDLSTVRARLRDRNPDSILSELPRCLHRASLSERQIAQVWLDALVTAYRIRSINVSGVIAGENQRDQVLGAHRKRTQGEVWPAMRSRKGSVHSSLCISHRWVKNIIATASWSTGGRLRLGVCTLIYITPERRKMQRMLRRY